MSDLSKRISRLEAATPAPRRRPGDPAHPIFKAMAARGLLAWSDDRADWVMTASLPEIERAYIDEADRLDPPWWAVPKEAAVGLPVAH
jgi:hypothetical protein